MTTPTGYEKAIRPEDKVKQLKVLSRKEVLRHNTTDDCWIIVHNEVYDITPFLKMHPGGQEILMARAGEDATSYFAVKHGLNDRVKKQLRRMRIGVLPESEWVLTNDMEDPFLMELVDTCYKKGLFTIPKTIKNPYAWLRAANVVAFFALSLLALYGGLPIWAAIILVAAQAIIGTSAFGFIAHEATHRNFPKNKGLKFLMNMAWPVFWPFIPQEPLRYEHNSHHIKIGDPEYDFEVAGFAVFIRYSGLVMPKAMHKYQYKIARYLYPFYANIITTFGGAKSTFWSGHNRNVAWIHAINIFATAAYFVVIPTLVTGQLWTSILLYFVYQCVLFYGIYIGSAINHFIPEVTREVPEGMEDNYAYYICQNTSNFCMDSPFWFWYSGGFNIQIEHHLIPFIPVENLRKMIPILKDLCARYNYPYHEFKSVKTLWDAHYNYLAMMAEATDGEEVKNEIQIKKNYSAR